MLSNTITDTHKCVSVRGDSDAVAPEPSGETVRRLAVEAGEYVVVEAGESLPVVEVRRQAEANGYAPNEIDGLLADAGVRGADAITVPEQGDLFGELWKPSGILDAGTTTDTDSSALERFREWLQSKADDGETKHAYSRRKANERFAKAKDVGRYFVSEYDTFSTVLVTYCAERQPDESIPDHAGRFYPESVTRKRRRILKGLDMWDDYAGVSVLAPKNGSGDADRVPGAETTTTHAHDFYWIPGEVSRSDFEGLIRLHTKHVEGATDENNPVDKAVTVETHRSSEVKTPEKVADRGSDMDAQRGATTALPQEVGNNLPLLQAGLDARALPAYAQQWCAQMCLGSDRETTKKGVPRFRQLGRFKQVADAWQWRR